MKYKSMNFILPLQQYDISQYLFEEMCEEYCFWFYEYNKTRHDVDDNYEKIWNLFYSFNPNRLLKYEYITSLGTSIKIENDGEPYYDEFGWKIKIK